MRLTYQAFDKAGHEVRETIESPSANEATETLRGRGLYVTWIGGEQEQPARGAGVARVAVRSRAPRRVRAGKRLRHLAMFMRQLYVLVNSGTPLVDALSALERQVREGPWRDVIGSVRGRVEEGHPLSDALAAHPDYFDSVTRSLVAAGESSGNLPTMLDRLAVMAKKQLHVRGAVVGAMIYPMLLSVISVSVLLLLLVFVIPRFGELFETLGVPLPPTTEFLVRASDVLRNYWWMAGAALVACAVGVKLWTGSASGRRSLDTLVLRLPQFGRIVRNFTTARIARLLGVLLQGHVSVLDSIEMTRGAVRNCHYADLMDKAHEAVLRGDAISSAFRHTDLISPSVYEALHHGEQSGQVAPLLLNVADFLDEENEVVVKSLTSILEPVILVVMGLLVGFVAMSLFLPLFDLTAMTQGGPK